MGGWCRVGSDDTFQIRQAILVAGSVLVLALPQPDYFDGEAKCDSRLLEFCQVTFCLSVTWQNLNNLPSHFASSAK